MTQQAFQHRVCDSRVEWSCAAAFAPLSKPSEMGRGHAQALFQIEYFCSKNCDPKCLDFDFKTSKGSTRLVSRKRDA